MSRFLYESKYNLPPKENNQEANTLAAYCAYLQFHIRVHNTAVKFDVFTLRQYAAGHFANEATKLTGFSEFLNAVEEVYRFTDAFTGVFLRGETSNLIHEIIGGVREAGRLGELMEAVKRTPELSTSLLETIVLDGAYVK